MEEGKITSGPDVVRLNKQAKLLTHRFTSVFKGFEEIDTVRKLFGADTKHVLSNLRILLFPGREWGGYFWIDDRKGILVGNLDYIINADKRHVYLDVIHELVHIKQHMNGVKLFDDSLEYFKRPTELEAYKIGVEEAKRLGMRKKEIIDYLKVDWASEKDFRRFLKTLQLTE